jgi:hypothetical protein
MPDWLLAVLGGLVLLAVVVKAFWNPPKPDPHKSHRTNLPPGAAGGL